jgi:hypothetical protein
MNGVARTVAVVSCGADAASTAGAVATFCPVETPLRGVCSAAARNKRFMFIYTLLF